MYLSADDENRHTIILNTSYLFMAMTPEAALFGAKAPGCLYFHKLPIGW